jgi:hypothetical protein
LWASTLLLVFFLQGIWDVTQCTMLQAVTHAQVKKEKPTNEGLKQDLSNMDMTSSVASSDLMRKRNTKNKNKAALHIIRTSCCLLRDGSST